MFQRNYGITTQMPASIKKGWCVQTLAHKEIE